MADLPDVLNFLILSLYLFLNCEKLFYIVIYLPSSYFKSRSTNFKRWQFMFTDTDIYKKYRHGTDTFTNCSEQAEYLKGTKLYNF